MGEERFFIYDCDGRVVGNPQGYRTIRGAIQQQDRKGSPAWRAIWAAYDQRKKRDPGHTLVSEIKTREGNA